VKVLFDSNIYVSDAIYGGAAAKAIKSSINARWRIFVSDFIVGEVERVLREKFHRDKKFISEVVADMRDGTHRVEEVSSRHRVLDDPADTPILRAALAAGVDYLVTGDGVLLAMNPHESLRIISLAEYIEILRNYGFISR
jgi:putative PIN family toxin of toxin-antitoxin system